MKSILLPFFLLLSLFAVAQTATLSSGGEGSGPGGTISFSIGQLVVEETEDSDGSISPGVQQTYESSVVFVDELRFKNTLSVFPNPTTNAIQLKFDSPFVGDIKVFDLQGKIVVQEKVNTDVMTLDASAWNTGVYLVHVIEKGTTCSIYKIIKN